MRERPHSLTKADREGAYKTPGRRFVAMLLVGLAWLAPPLSGHSEEALAKALSVYRSGDMALAFRRFSTLAELGNAEAQYYLSSFYEQGLGIEKDPESALALTQDAALKGFAPAQTRTGWYYHQGFGTPADIDTALNWYQKAAAQDEKTALIQLGVLYTGKQEVEKDFPRARDYFLRAAELGSIIGAHNAAILYQIEIKPPGRQRPRWSATEQALKWFTFAAERHYAEAQFELGNMHSLGSGIPRSYEQAVFWYSLAADNGHEEAARRRSAVELNLDNAHRAKIRAELREWRMQHPQ